MGKSHPWRPWQPEELKRLQALLGQAPMADVVRRWNRWAAGQGIPLRSEASLRRKALALGRSVRPDGEWVAIGTAAQYLGRSESCLQKWIRHGWLRRRHGAIVRASLVALAQDRSHLFAGCPREGLLALLRDEGLADQLTASYPRSRAVPRQRRPVECIDTGEVFTSMRAAGRALHLDGSAVALAVREGRPAAGLRFRLVT